jgi:4-amino-4-deoxychorismate lyase
MNPNQTPIQALINGKPAMGLSVLDRGFVYGDGVFRTLAITKGVSQHWDLHYQKLHDDCARLNISCPEADTLLSDIQSLFANDDGVAKIVITRGESARGYGYPDDIQANRILIKSTLPQYPEDNFANGVKLHLCELRLSHQTKLAGIKHLNRLENVLARHEWNDLRIADGLLLDRNGLVIECTMSNVFARFGNRLVTPLLDQCGVAGVTRDRVIANAAYLDLTASEENIPLSEFMEADEILICNSLFGVWQVAELNHQRWKKQSLADKLNVLLKD